MGCSYCSKNNNILLKNELSFIHSQSCVLKELINSESYAFSEESSNTKLFNNTIKKNNLKSVNVSPIKNELNTSNNNKDELFLYLVNKLCSYIKGFLFRKRYEEYLKTQLMDHANELYFQFIFLTKNFTSTKILNNEENEKLKNIMKTSWASFYSKDPTISIKNQLNKAKKYANGMIFKYKNSNYNSDSIDQCLRNVEYCYKGSIELITNKKCGYGELISINGEQSIGTFLNDEFSGWNIHIKSNGELYVGLFINDLLNGHGICYNMENEYLFKGIFKDSQKEGYGEEFSEGNNYKGEFKEDRKCGKGEIIFKNNDVYIGEFENDRIIGLGKYIWKNNEKEYEGNFVNGKINGNGLLKWGKFKYYKGMFINGIKEGKGEFGYINRKKYFFNFKNNLPFDEGYYINKDNEKCIVSYNQGKIIDKFNHEVIFLFE